MSRRADFVAIPPPVEKTVAKSHATKRSNGPRYSVDMRNNDSKEYFGKLAVTVSDFYTYSHTST